MKKTILVFMTAGALFFSAPSHSAFAAEGPSVGPYVSGAIGLSVLNSGDVKNPTTRAAGVDVDFTSKTGPLFSIAAGYGFGDTRLEGEVSYRRNELKDARVAGLGNVNLNGHTSSLAFMLNGYYDFSNETPFTTFLTAGIGAARVSINERLENLPGLVDPYLDDSDTVFAYQAGLGVGYAINGRVTLDITYRFFGTLKPEFQDATEYRYRSHNFCVGLRYSF